MGDFRFAPTGDRLGFPASPPESEADAELAERRGEPMVRDSADAPEWTHLWVEASHRTGRRLYRIPLDADGTSGSPRAASDVELCYRGFSASDTGRTLAFRAEGPATPPNVCASDIARFRPRRLTRLNPEAERFRLGQIRVVR